jgi:hypothetical protein
VGYKSHVRFLVTYFSAYYYRTGTRSEHFRFKNVAFGNLAKLESKQALRVGALEGGGTAPRALGVPSSPIQGWTPTKNAPLNNRDFAFGKILQRLMSRNTYQAVRRGVGLPVLNLLWRILPVGGRPVNPLSILSQHSNSLHWCPKSLLNLILLIPLMSRHLTLGSGSCDFPILHLLDVSSFRNIKN